MRGFHWWYFDFSQVQWVLDWEKCSWARLSMLLGEQASHVRQEAAESGVRPQRSSRAGGRETIPRGRGDIEPPGWPWYPEQQLRRALDLEKRGGSREGWSQPGVWPRLLRVAPAMFQGWRARRRLCWAGRIPGVSVLLSHCSASGIIKTNRMPKLKSEHMFMGVVGNTEVTVVSFCSEKT